MDALISAFVDEIKQKAVLYNEDGENLFNDNSSTEPDECLVPLKFPQFNVMCFGVFGKGEWW